jgi:PEP-CTERM motif
MQICSVLDECGGCPSPARCWMQLLIALLVLCGLSNSDAQSSTLWTGPTITFTEPAGGSGSNPANQDRLTANVWLTRDITKGLYNAAQEFAYTKDVSPVDTAWAYGSLDNYSSLTYQAWELWNSGNPPSMLNHAAVVHLISDDIYLSVTFTAWGGSAGGFSYQRSTPVPEPSTAALLLAGIALIVFARRPSP